MSFMSVEIPFGSLLPNCPPGLGWAAYSSLSPPRCPFWSIDVAEDSGSGCYILMQLVKVVAL